MKYKQYIESDKALERRFQTVKVSEPSVEDTILILRGLKEHYEKHHQIEYHESALIAAAKLSDRFIRDRQLPDKAIDLLDEAGAKRRIQVVYNPPELREMEAQRHELIKKKSAAFERHSFEEMAKWQMQLSVLEDTLSSERRKQADKFLKEDRIVSEEEIALLIEKSTGIPSNRLVAEESQKLLNLEKRLENRVVGQKHAISMASHAIKRNRSGLKTGDSPVASFLFLGPTGVGKTELARALAAELHDDESKMIRIDMSEYMEKHSVSKLIGSPPGYVGYGDGGQLTEKVRHQPYSVVLLDEFEKAHPDVYNLLLQVLDEGWLTDGEGNKVSFSNTVIIGTSNIGSTLLMDRKKPVGFSADDNEWNEDSTKKMILDEVKNFLKPELMNRFDDIVIFNPLTEVDLKEILKLKLNQLSSRLKNMNLELRYGNEILDHIISSIDTTSFGARPLRRKLEMLVENKIAEFLISNSPQIGNIELKISENEINIVYTN